ncbi:hypothetical protein [Pectobacterium brasiliense]|uniref:hypothetical protein n=1 Tax=Pectobacterium brasiliense TaxID=180957 RepID=UPI003986A94B
MTTIAWDGRTLAADSQSNLNGAVCSLKEQKIFKPFSGEEWKVYGETVLAIGVSGDCGAECELIDALSGAGLDYKTQFQPSFDFAALLIVSAERVYVVAKDEDKTAPAISPQFGAYAIGSGAMIARTAMHLGKRAIEAVQTAIEMDLYTGGDISSFSVEQAPFIIVKNQE